MEAVKTAEGLQSMALPYSPDRPREVIERYKDMVYRIAFAYCKNPTDAEDIAQEVFLRWLKRTAGFRGEEHLKAWLIRVTVNASKNLLRSAWFRKTATLSEHENPRAEEQAQPETVDAVMSLPEKYRAVVLLYYYEDYPVKDIAKILRRTETAVQTQLQRARAMLKKTLQEEWQDDQS